MSGKKVNRLGFRFLLPKNMSAIDYFNSFLELNEKAIGFEGAQHVLHVNFKDDFFVGQIVKYKEDETFLESKRDEQGKHVLHKREVTEGFNGTEVCSFVINPHSCKGLIDTYQGSVNPTVFRKILNKVSSNARKQLIKFKSQELLKKDQDELTHSQANGKAREYYSGKFEFHLIMTNEDLQNISVSIKRIKKIIVDFEPSKIKDSVFSPLTTISKAGKFEVNVDEGISLSKIKGDISAVWNTVKGKESKLRFLGELHSGETIRRELGDNLQYFGVQKYQDYVSTLPEIYWSNYYYSKSISNLISSMKDFVAEFGKTSCIEVWSSGNFKNVELYPIQSKENKDGTDS